MHVSYSEFRAKLSTHMDRVAESHAPLVVTRQSGKGNMVVLSEEDWEGWLETIHLLSSPANAVWLLESIRQADAGQVVERDLVDS